MPADKISNECSETSPLSRRPIKTRDSKWARTIAAALARVPVKPNTISVFSAVFAALAGACFAATVCPHIATGPVATAVLFVCGAVGVQMRLLCNLFDGMVAVEGGFKTKSGEVFNELPDRFADAFILIGFGYAASAFRGGVELGYIAAALAIITAYVRALGASAGAGQNFIGPMAKQHRMATVTVSSIVAAGCVLLFAWRGGVCVTGHVWVVFAALGIMIAGMIVTIARRTAWVIRTLESK